MPAAERDDIVTSTPPAAPESPWSASAVAIPRLARPEDFDLIGRVVAGRYAIARLVGRGGMGAVYEAEHLGLGRRVALKFVDAEHAMDEAVVARFAREARATSTIDSAHVVSAFDVGEEGGRPYLVMELLRGEDLGARLRRLGRLPVRDALHVTAQVLRGLVRAHEAGIVHRDLKPDNVFLVRREADELFVKLVDFGVSKVHRSRAGTVPLAITGKGTVIGTPLYMAPEQAQALADVDGRADVWSVGAILFECLAGRPPHVGRGYEQIILAICMRDAPDVRTMAPDVPAELAAWIARALARRREDRFASAEAALDALAEPSEIGDRIVSKLTIAAPEELGVASVARPAEASPSLPPPVATSTTRGAAHTHSREKVRAAATALLALLAGVAAATGWIRWHTPVWRGGGEVAAVPSAPERGGDLARDAKRGATLEAAEPPGAAGVDKDRKHADDRDDAARGAGAEVTRGAPMAGSAPTANAGGARLDTKPKKNVSSKGGRPMGRSEPGRASPPLGPRVDLELQRELP